MASKISDNLKIAIISSAMTLVIAILSGYLSYRWGLESQIKLQDN